MSRFDYSDRNIPLIQYYDLSNFDGIFYLYDRVSRSFNTMMDL